MDTAYGNGQRIITLILYEKQTIETIVCRCIWQLFNEGEVNFVE